MNALLDKLQLKDVNPGACTGPDGWIEDPNGKELVSLNPTTNQPIARVIQATAATYDKVVEAARDGALSPRPNGACWCEIWAMPCENSKNHWVNLSPWKWVKSKPKA